MVLPERSPKISVCVNTRISSAGNNNINATFKVTPLIFFFFIPAAALVFRQVVLDLKQVSLMNGQLTLLSALIFFFCPSVKDKHPTIL